MVKSIEMDETESLSLKSENTIEQLNQEISLHISEDTNTHHDTNNETSENIEELKSSLFENEEI
jgi:hypothetical protein